MSATIETTLLEKAEEVFVCQGVTSEGDALNLIGALLLEILNNGGGGGTGDVVGPASSTNNSLARWDGTTGELLKDGLVTSAGGFGATDNGKVPIFNANGGISFGSATTDSVVNSVVVRSGLGISGSAQGAGGVVYEASLGAAGTIGLSVHLDASSFGALIDGSGVANTAEGVHVLFDNACFTANDSVDIIKWSVRGSDGAMTFYSGLSTYLAPVNSTTLTGGVMSGNNIITLPSETGTIALRGANTFTGVQLLPDGSAAGMALGFSGSPTTGIYRNGTGNLVISYSGQTSIEIGNIAVNLQNVNLTVNYVYQATGARFIMHGGLTTFGASAAATIQFGADDPTTPTAQTLKAHDVTAGTGANMIIAGGKGSVAGGAVILATSTTTGAPTSVLKIGADGYIDFESATASPDPAAVATDSFPIKIGGATYYVLVRT